MNASNYALTPSAALISTYEDARGYTPGVPAIVGKHLIALRTRAGFETQQKLAAKAKVDASKLSKLENDRPVNLTLITLERLAKALKVPVRELFNSPRPEGATGHGVDDKGIAVLQGLLQSVDQETPAEDSWRGDVLKAVAALNRALRRPDTKSGVA